VGDVSDLLAESVTRLFRDGTAQRTATAEFDAALWNQTQEMGLSALLVSEDQGGIGGSWEDALAVLQPAGFYAIALPIAENMLARRLLAAARLESDAGMAVAAPGEGALQIRKQGFLFSGSFRSLPWGRNAKSIVTCVVLDETTHVVVLPSDGATLHPATNLAGEPRDELRFEACAARAAPCDAPEAAQLYDFCALLRLAQVVGALDAALTLSTDYACERKQFGRAIGQFQAVQQLLALFGAEAAAVSCAVRAAFRAATFGDAFFQIAAAKLRANMAIGPATATAHQVHAAIGFTWEHGLHHLTQRLMSWRSEFGNDRYWSERLGGAIAARGADRFWSDLTARDDDAALVT
jgi:acyl-CoA dehydrogenase